MGESVVGARGKPKLVLGAKVPMGEGPTSLWMPATRIGTSPVKDCQRPGAGSNLPALNRPL